MGGRGGSLGGDDGDEVGAGARRWGEERARVLADGHAGGGEDDGGVVARAGGRAGGRGNAAVRARADAEGGDGGAAERRGVRGGERGGHGDDGRRFEVGDPRDARSGGGRRGGRKIDAARAIEGRARRACASRRRALGCERAATPIPRGIGSWTRVTNRDRITDLIGGRGRCRCGAVSASFSSPDSQRQRRSVAARSRFDDFRGTRLAGVVIAMQRGCALLPRLPSAVASARARERARDEPRVRAREPDPDLREARVGHRERGTREWAPRALRHTRRPRRGAPRAYR